MWFLDAADGCVVNTADGRIDNQNFPGFSQMKSGAGRCLYNARSENQQHICILHNEQPISTRYVNMVLVCTAVSIYLCII